MERGGTMNAKRDVFRWTRMTQVVGLLAALAVPLSAAQTVAPQAADAVLVRDINQETITAARNLPLDTSVSADEVAGCAGALQLAASSALAVAPSSAALDGD